MTDKSTKELADKLAMVIAEVLVYLFCATLVIGWLIGAVLIMRALL